MNFAELVVSLSLALACLALASNWAMWRNWILSRESGIALAILRIGFGSVLLLNHLDLLVDARFLFSSDGLFNAEDARERFSGIGPSEDFVGDAIEIAGCKCASPLLWNNAPALVFLWFSIAIAALVFFIVGLYTRVAGVAAFLAYNWIYCSNEYFWHSTELLFRCVFVYLLLGDCGARISLDRSVRRRMRADVSALPRRLIFLQCVVVYVATGLEKTGPTWEYGTSVYYALLSDHFARFGLQDFLSSAPLWILRVASYATLTFEILYFLPLIGAIVRRTPASSGSDGALDESLRRGNLRRGLVVVALALAVVARYLYAPEAGASFVVLVAGGLIASLQVAGVRSRVIAVAVSPLAWAGLTIAFHLLLLIFLDIGVFQLLMIVLVPSMIDAHWLDRRLGLRSSSAPAPAAGRDQVQLSSSRRSVLLVAATIASLLLGWAYASALLLGCSALLALAAVCRLADHTGQRWKDNWLSVAFAWHFLALVIWLLPSTDGAFGVNGRVRAYVFWWVRNTETTQRWVMFAPDVATRNSFVHVVLVDELGLERHVVSDVYSDPRAAMPGGVRYLWRRVHRRIYGIGFGNPPSHRASLARWYCRNAERWTETPVSHVLILEDSYAIPTFGSRGGYSPSEMLRVAGRSVSRHRETCQR